MKTYLLSALLLVSSVHSFAGAASLAELENQALADDAGLRASRLQFSAAQSLVDAAPALDDAKLKFSAANVPTDSFAFDAEPMTQAIVGIARAFPAGDSRALRRSRANIEQEAALATSLLREKEVVRAVRAAWLDAWVAQHEALLLEEKQQLLQKLVSVEEARYGSGESTQSKVSQLQLQLATLNESRIRATGQFQEALARLRRWVAIDADISWPDTLPDTLSQLPKTDGGVHPLLQLAEAKLQINEVERDLQRQQYKPDWVWETSYGYRQDRSDFISVGVTVGLPWLSGQRNDAKLAAAEQARQASEAMAEDQRRQLDGMLAELTAAVVTLRERLDAYETHILPQLSRLGSLAESDYASGRGPFSASLEIKRQRVDEGLKMLGLQRERATKLIDIRWLLEGVRS